MNVILNKFLYVLLLGLVMVGCSNIQTDRSYQEIGRAEHFNLNEPGYIVGIEKRNIKKNNNEYLAGIDSVFPYKSRFVPLVEVDEFSEKQNEKYKEVTDSQTKVMLVTQITKKFPIQEYVYNAYKENLDGEYDFERSFSKLDEMSLVSGNLVE